MTDGQELIQERVVSTAERLEELDEDAGSRALIDELDPLEAEYVVSGSGYVKEVTLVLSTGGPHIEVNLTKARVDGYWGGEEHSVPVFNERPLDELDDFYRHQFEECYLQ